MKIIIFLISIIIAIISVYIIGRSLYTHKQLIRTYKENEYLFIFHVIMVMLLSVIITISIVAFNNTTFCIE